MGNVERKERRIIGNTWEVKTEGREKKVKGKKKDKESDSRQECKRYNTKKWRKGKEKERKSGKI